MNFEKLNVQWSACCTANPENAVRSATSQQQLRFLLIFCQALESTHSGVPRSVLHTGIADTLRQFRYIDPSLVLQDALDFTQVLGWQRTYRYCTERIISSLGVGVRQTAC